MSSHLVCYKINRVRNFIIGLALRVRPILKLLARLLPELYSTHEPIILKSSSKSTNLNIDLLRLLKGSDGNGNGNVAKTRFN